MPNKSEAAAAQPLIPSFRSDKFTKVYANSANLEITPWDFKLVFGELIRDKGEHKIEEIVAVVMSPQHAKALLNVMQNNVREYEKQVGEIKLPQALNAEPQNAAPVPKSQ
jgi:hypothetical protein